MRRPEAKDVKRLVFVCHGNICRSAYADVLARKFGASASSFGLSTSTGKPAHPPIAAIADARHLDLHGHLTTAVEDYQPQPGDYLLAMEVRHLRKIAANPALRAIPRGLLGSYGRVPVPHLHDPYKLNPAYAEVCITRIEGAVAGLIKTYPSAIVSGSNR
ncbi:arsenate reductase/protein-tyrosine-phosphatase family protein [Novosphingobium aquimarinum]|uniref:arsenate reductase/protein-tyrosine-phosphatase family protein n=1 Tax=Novosphingobium aquimarinum TaxID=2682494 RepID=UPI002FC38F48